MKKLFIMLGILSIFLAFTACNNDDDDAVVKFADLPASVGQFLNDHFPGTTDENSFMSRDDDSYDVVLNSGYKIEFSLDGTWENVDGKINGTVKPMPESFLELDPISIIRDYVKVNYAENVFIVEVDKEHDKQGNHTGYEIDLNDNSHDIKFDKNGNKIG